MSREGLLFQVHTITRRHSSVSLMLLPVATFILMQIKYRTCLNSGHAVLACAYQRGQSITALTYCLLNLLYPSQSPHLFLKLGQQAEQIITWAHLLLVYWCVCYHSPSHGVVPSTLHSLKSVNCLKLCLGGCIMCTGSQRNRSGGLSFLLSGHYACVSLLPLA